MATGNTLVVWTPAANNPPATLYANFNTRNNHLVLEFDAATNWDAIFKGIMPRHYAGGGVTVYIHWMAATATTGNTLWNAAFEADAAQDEDSDGFATANASSTDACNGTCGVETISSIAFTDGAQMDSVAVGGEFRFKVTRNATDGTDTMAGLAQVKSIEMKET